MPDPVVSDTVTRAALAGVGWIQPTNNLPVLPFAMPVIVLGAPVIKYKTMHDNLTGGGPGVYTPWFTCPAGKQWSVLKLNAIGGPAGWFAVRPSVINTSADPFVISATVFTTRPGAIVPSDTDAKPSNGVVKMQAGDTIGALSATAVTTDMSISVEETDAP